jgi:hypothetical protein
MEGAELPRFRVPCSGSVATLNTGMGITIRGMLAAPTGITPVEINGMITMTAAAIDSMTKAAAIGQRFLFPSCGHDSSRVSRNIIPSCDEEN